MRRLTCATVATVLVAALLAGCDGSRPTGPDTPWRSTGKGRAVKSRSWCNRHKDDRWCRTHTPAECGWRWCKGQPAWCAKNPKAKRCEGIKETP